MHWKQGFANFLYFSTVKGVLTDEPERWCVYIYIYSSLGVQLPFMEWYRIKNKETQKL